MIISLSAASLAGCNSNFVRHETENGHALRSLAGGAVGALIAGNAGGAIVGALVSDIYSITTIKYEDKKIENGDEAARRLNPKIEKVEGAKEPEKKVEGAKEPEKKVEGAKEPEKKVEGAKEPEKKVEGAKEPEKKVEGAKEPEKKVEEPRGRQQRAEKKRDEDRVNLFIKEQQEVRQTVKAGFPVEAKIQYSVLAGDDVKEVTITERRILFAENKHIELDTREIVREQGTYLTTIKFKVPDEISNGYCILYTTISDGKSSRTAKTVIHIL